MNNVRVFYKVVRKYKSGYKSCSINPRSKYCLTYKIGETVKEKEGSLGIFLL